jgi:hypothetical protein
MTGEKKMTDPRIDEALSNLRDFHEERRRRLREEVSQMKDKYRELPEAKVEMFMGHNDIRGLPLYLLHSSDLSSFLYYYGFNKKKYEGRTYPVMTPDQLVEKIRTHLKAREELYRKENPK